ncbi:MAG TPA: hypothetical protein VF275_04175 [Gammaproteobacteria bacterium]
MRNWKPEWRRFLPLAVVMLAACSEPVSPEQRVREFIAETEVLVENREFAEVVDRIAGDYLDAQGNDKMKAAAFLRGFYLRNKSVHLLTRIDSIALPSPERATATIYVAIAKQPFDNVSTFPDADIFRLEIALAEDGDSYEILQTRWRRASAAEAIF